MTEIPLQDGKIVRVASCVRKYFESRNNVDYPMVSGKSLKQLLQNNETTGIAFHRPKRVDESERVSIKITLSRCSNSTS